MAFELERLRANLPIVDGAGRPTLAFQRWWQTQVEAIEGQEAGQDDVLAALAAAQADLAAQLAMIIAAQAAADEANATNAAQNDYIRSRDSYLTASPLTASTASGASTITIADHTRYYQNPASSVAVTGGSIAGLTPGTVYYVFYDDPDFAGGVVTYQTTTVQENAVASVSAPGRHFVSVIPTPTSDGGSSSGSEPNPPPWKVGDPEIP